MTEATYHVKNISINGVPRRVIGKPEVSLLTVIRDQLKMTGTKRGCDHGQCGVCNVIMDGKVVRSCITKWKNVPEHAQITTIEGIGTPENLHALQWAFIVCGAIQCGFCTLDLSRRARHFWTSTRIRRGKRSASGTASTGWPAAAQDMFRS